MSVPSSAFHTMFSNRLHVNPDIMYFAYRISVHDLNTQKNIIALKCLIRYDNYLTLVVSVASECFRLHVA